MAEEKKAEKTNATFTKLDVDFNILFTDLDAVFANYSRQVFTAQEQTLHHNSYDQEVREQLAIELGDAEMLKEAVNETKTGQVGIVAKDDPLRNHKDIGIVVITLACRSAMRSGVLPEIAYTLSDNYINKIEKINSVPEVIAFYRAAEFHYCSVVHDMITQTDSNEEHQYSLHISRCKKYIFAHLHGRITVSEIASALRLNTAYLSNIFSKYEGITISRYIIKQKIKLIKNMLVYSPYTLSQIAFYFGFVSQSHLGAEFRKEVGCTPGQYRRKYGNKDFINSKKPFSE